MLINANNFDISNNSELLGENIIVQGIIDAFFIEENENGEKHFVLVDFKTNWLNENNLDREIHRLKELYKRQMLTYEKALKHSNYADQIYIGERNKSCFKMDSSQYFDTGMEPEIEKIIYHIGTNICIKY